MLFIANILFGKLVIQIDILDKSHIESLDSNIGN